MPNWTYKFKFAEWYTPDREDTPSKWLFHMPPDYASIDDILIELYSTEYAIGELKMRIANEERLQFSKRTTHWLRKLQEHAHMVANMIAPEILKSLETWLDFHTGSGFANTVLGIDELGEQEIEMSAIQPNGIATVGGNPEMGSFTFNVKEAVLEPYLRMNPNWVDLFYGEMQEHWREDAEYEIEQGYRTEPYVEEQIDNETKLQMVQEQIEEMGYDWEELQNYLSEYGPPGFEEAVRQVIKTQVYPAWRQFWGESIEIAEKNVGQAYNILEQAIESDDLGNLLSAINIALNTQHVHGKMSMHMDISNSTLDELSNLDTEEIDQFVDKITGVEWKSAKSLMSWQQKFAALETEWWRQYRHHLTNVIDHIFGERVYMQVVSGMQHIEVSFYIEYNEKTYRCYINLLFDRDISDQVNSYQTEPELANLGINNLVSGIDKMQANLVSSSISVFKYSEEQEHSVIKDTNWHYLGESQLSLQESTPFEIIDTLKSIIDSDFDDGEDDEIVEPEPSPEIYSPSPELVPVLNSSNNWFQKLSQTQWGQDRLEEMIIHAFELHPRIDKYSSHFIFHHRTDVRPEDNPDNAIAFMTEDHPEPPPEMMANWADWPGRLFLGIHIKKYSDLPGNPLETDNLFGKVDIYLSGYKSRGRPERSFTQTLIFDKKDIMQIPNKIVEATYDMIDKYYRKNDDEDDDRGNQEWQPEPDPFSEGWTPEKDRDILQDDPVLVPVRPRFREKVMSTESSNWQYKFADYEEYRALINQHARNNPLPFSSWFPNGQNRIYLPFYSNSQEIDDEVAGILTDIGCEVTDYRGGYCQRGRNTLRISKAIEQAMVEALREIDAKNQRGEIYDYEREVAETKQYYNDALDVFVNSPFRVDAHRNQYYIVISQDPHDLAKMSTDQHWTSCMELGEGSHHQDVYCEVESGGMIAYLVREEGEQDFTNPVTPGVYRRYLGTSEVENAIARIHLRRFENVKGQSIVVPEQSVYGNEVQGFREKIQEWLKEHQGQAKPGWYKRKGGEYSDSFGDGMLITPENPQDIVMWLRGEDEDAVYSTWIVKDNLYDTEVAWDEDQEEETKFNTREEAEQYVDSMQTDDSWRDYYGGEWTEQDEETGEFLYDRYTIHEDIHDHRRDMLNQALKKILRAKRGTYPDEVVNEAIAKVKEQYSASPQNRMFEILAEYYPEHVDKSQIKKINRRLYYKQIREMEEGPEKERLINDEITAAESWMLPTLEEVAKKDKTHDDRMLSVGNNLDTAIRDLRMSTDVQSKVDAERNIASRWYSIFSDKVLSPLQEIYSNHKTKRPLPEGVVQKLVNFATTILPGYQFPSATELSSMDRSIGRKRSLQYTDQAQSSIAHLFSTSGADSPTVQNFYKSLLPKWGLYDVAFDEPDQPSKRSEINIETLGWSIAQLGENGRDFLPFMKEKLAEAEQIYNNSVREGKEGPSQYRGDRKIALAKKNIERHLYVIDALERGRPSGKYRFSSKCWTHKFSQDIIGSKQF